MARRLYTLPDSWGVDTSAKVSMLYASALADAVYTAKDGTEHPIEFLFRYVSLTDEKKWDLDRGEVDGILAARGPKTGRRLAMCGVQRVREPSWVASGLQGTLDGKNAARNAMSVGFLAGMHLGDDLEGLANPGPAVKSHAIEYCKALYGEAGLLALFYEGFDWGLRPEDVDELQQAGVVPVAPLFWRDFAQRKPPTRGFACQQEEGNARPWSLPFLVDVDHAAPDRLGGAIVGMRDDDVADQAGDPALVTSDPANAGPPEGTSP
jgi:hypothetical protein